MPQIYKIAVNIAKNNMSHVILHKVDPVFKEIIEYGFKAKVGKLLQDDSNNSFRVNGYFGEYIILRAVHIGNHPVGDYLTEK